MTADPAEDSTVADGPPGDPVEADRVLVKAADRYVLLGQIGAGGMGEVFEAYDTKLDRRVALKFVRLDVDAQGSLLHEAKALAKLSHPNVVTVFDAGTHDERTFVAMEYVDGQTLADWARERDRDWRGVVELMVQAGRGLQAAHAHGLVHRDFKPGNVMISTSADGRLRARVLDFGIALAGPGPISPALSSSDSLDNSGSWSVRSDDSTAIVGTPGYMAPEQFLGHALDPRCDQFSFCVVLYRLLYGEDPFGKGRKRRSSVVEGKVRDPGRVSGVPRKLRSVVLRGLHPEPADRHPSMQVLLSKLERVLAARRRGVALGSVALAGVAVAAASVSAFQSEDPCAGVGRQLDGVWDQARRTEAAQAFSAVDRRFAEESWAATERHIDEFAEKWVEVRTRVCRSASQPDVSLGHLEQQQACLRKQRLAALALIDVLTGADADVARNAVDAATQLPRPEACEQPDPLSGFLDPPPAVSASAIETVEADLAESEALMMAGQWSRALDSMPAHLRAAEETGYRPLIGHAHYLKAMSHARLNQIDEAKAEYDSALREASASGDVWTQAKALTGLCNIYGLVSNEVRTGLMMCGHAEALLEKVGLPAQETARVRLIRATTLFKTGSIREARAQFEDVMELADQLPAGHRTRISAANNLAALLGMQGDHEEAGRVAQQGADWIEENLGAHHPLRASLLTSVGASATSRGRHEEARAAFELAIEISTDAFGEYQPETAVNVQNLGLVLMELGDLDAALETLVRALELKRTIYPDGNVSTAHTANNVGAVLLRLDRPEEAITYADEAIDLWIEKLGRDTAFAVIGIDTKVRALRALGRPVDLELIEHSLEVLSGSGLDPVLEAQFGFLAAQIFDEVSKDRARARRMTTEAIERYESTDSDPGTKVEEMRAWLKSHPASE